MACIAREEGPINLMLQLSQTSAKCGFPQPVAGMDCIDITPGCAHNAIDFQITLELGAAPMQIDSSAN
jgi:hypothetical protein